MHWGRVIERGGEMVRQRKKTINTYITKGR